MTEIGQRVRRVREALNLSQTAFAERMQYGRQHISSIERGAHKPGHRFVAQLAMLEREVAFQSTGDANKTTDILSPDRGIDKSHVGRLKHAGAVLTSPPHHVELPRIRETPGSTIREPHEEYAAAVNMIGHLFEHHPEAFKALMLSLRGIYETHKEKTK